MTERHREPQRLRESDPSARQLLDSARGDNPSRATLRAAPVAITGLLAAHASAASAASAAGVAAVGVKSSVVGVVLVGKWLGLGLLAGAVLSVGASVAVPAREAAPRPEVVRTIQSRAPSRAPSASFSSSPTVLPTASVTQPLQRARLEPARSEPTTDLAREIALLDAASRALHQHEAARALQLLDSGTALPSRALVPEATVLRVRALLQLHLRDDAERVVEEFARSSPRSPQLAVLRGLVHPAKIP